MWPIMIVDSSTSRRQRSMEIKTDVRLIEEVKQHVGQYYLDSGDYNGISLSQLAARLGVKVVRLRKTVIDLAKAEMISIVSPRQSNPFVKMFDVPIKEQLDGLEERDPKFVCLYPTRAAIEEVIDPSDYDDRPFTKSLILVAPKLVALPFRLDVLDAYDRDPRYWFRFYDFGGTISTHGEYYEQMTESDRCKLRFGVGYDDQADRVVAVYLYDLGSLSGRQQRIWKEFWVDRNCTMSEEYFKTTILAQLPDTVSVYEAVIHEQVEINKLSSLMGRQGLFRKTYEDQRRPRGFSFFIKPTQGEYDSFVQLLDKMLSENIDLGFYGDDVERYRKVETGQGEFERQSKGSIALLEEWLIRQYLSIGAAKVAVIIGPLRKVRKLRQKPAHTIGKDLYDKGLYEMQDELVWEVYRSLSALRHLLMEDDSTSCYQPPSWDGSLTVKSY